ncbi:uncharacterized protein [Dysidea avara]|uniref:uncharacterized protein n=1 Tax=Dysidea avara TaxID=196820 RepID=UPI003319F208
MALCRNGTNFKCPLCSFNHFTVKDILSHIRAYHSNEPNFCVTCGLDGCSTTSRTFSGLYSHIYRHHREYIDKRGSCNADNDDIVESTSNQGKTQAQDVAADSTSRSFDEPLTNINDQGVELTADIEFLTGHDREAIKRSSALLLLKLKEHHRLSQAAIDDVVEGFRGLFTSTMEYVKAALRSKLADIGFNPCDINAMDEVFNDIEEPFSGLATEYQQNAYYLNQFHLVKPEEILVGDPHYVPQFSGSKRRLVEKQDSYQYVPLLASLKAMLHDLSVREQVQQLPERLNGDKIKDFCDGTRFKTHPLFSQDPCALQIVAHFDELEVCNPLGSHVKSNKVGVVSYTLGNIHPKYRSKLKLTQLAIVATIPVIEAHGIHTIMKPFIHDLNILATEGIVMPIDGVNQVFKGALLVFLADNLASNDLGGFKKSFSFSYRCCHTCLVTQTSLSFNFYSEAYKKEMN